ncbi:MAG TPA: efflux RND transporter periplasmic adaptor subunit [Opitutaceae bacterium]|nr:efflux RND transporter periplasmic adaptor subunit [Opitutaceae bacterium]
MAKKIILTTLGILAVTGFIVGTKVIQIKKMIDAAANQVEPVEVVTAAAVKADSWENIISVTGSCAAVQGVTVGAEVAGKVTKIAFESGAAVKAGDLLVQLDISSEEAQLRAAESSAQLAKLNLDRSKELLAKTTISQAEYDATSAQSQQAVAQADALRALIAKKTIRAPFAGRLGLRLVNLGQILKEGDAISSLQTLDPIYVNFSIPQQRVSVLTVGTTLRVTSDAAPGDTFEGKITAVSPDIDPATRNVRAQATLANPAEKLHPGMFATVNVVLPTREDVLAIPATAVLYAPYGDSVYVIDDKKDEKTGQMQKVLRLQAVHLGTTRGDFVAVVSGLKAGESVVTSGVFKLHAGMVVTVDNTLAPNAQLAPKPSNS